MEEGIWFAHLLPSSPLEPQLPLTCTTDWSGLKWWWN